MNERLLIEQKRDKLKHAGRELTDEDKKTLQRLYKRKDDIAKKIFKSMADIIYFLERAAADPELIEDFEDTIKDLFDVGSDARPVRMESPLKSQYTTVERLLSAILFLDYSLPQQKAASHENSASSDFNVKLAHLVQGIIMHKTLVELYKKHGNSMITKSAAEDMDKALGWTHLVSSPLATEEREQKRIVQLPEMRVSKPTKDNAFNDLLYSDYLRLASPL